MSDVKRPREPKPLSQRYQTIPISKDIHYRYLEAGGKRTGEGIVTSDRIHPGVLLGKKFYSGVHQRGRFIPGFAANGRFVPGLITRRGFYPGLIVSNRFQPGIIAMGIFMPGIVHGKNFVPGVSTEHGFLPGSFTTDRKFIPGRFADGRFEGGVIDGHNFIPSNADRYTVPGIHALATEGYGLSKVRRYEPIGGLPINGIVIGMMGGIPSIVPEGLATNAGVILGGMWDESTLPVFGLEAELDKMGIDADESDDLVGLDDKYEDMIADLADGLFNPFDLGQQGPGLYDAFEQFGQGAGEIIDSMNRDQAEYWSDVFGRNAGGMISGSGGGQGSKKWDWDAFSERVGAGAIKGVQEGAIIGIAGGLVGVWNGAVIGGVTGAFTAAAEYAAEYGIEAFSDWVGSLFGSSSSPDEDGEGSANGFYIQPQHAPLGPALSRDTIFAVSEEGDVLGTGSSAITVTQTDHGAVIVANFAELAFYARNSPERGVNIGLNPLTGEAILATPLTPDRRAVIGKAFHQAYRDLITRPLEA